MRWIYIFHASKLFTLPKNVRNNEAVSVTRLGDLLDFGQVFKAFGNN